MLSILRIYLPDAVGVQTMFLVLLDPLPVGTNHIWIIESNHKQNEKVIDCNCLWVIEVPLTYSVLLMIHSIICYFQ